MQQGLITPSLTIGIDLAALPQLAANKGMSCVGYQLTGKGFVVDDEQASLLDANFGKHNSRIQPLITGRDITQEKRGLFAIDAFGVAISDLRNEHAGLYQWLLDRVKPERDENARPALRERWWIFGEARSTFRPALKGCARAIATSLTAKHRTFVFVPSTAICDSTTVMFALPDGFHLGILSSKLHIDWSLASHSRLGVGNDPRYIKSVCFETFPFPNEDTGLTPALRATISEKAEQIDAHRKQVLAAGHKGLTLTGIYNVLEALRAGRELTAKERTHHTQGLVGVLRELHDELDAAVLAAYGLPADADTDAVLHRLVQLNAERAREEAQGHVRWLRPDFQNPAAQAQLLKTELPAQARQGLEAKNTQNPQHAATADGDGATVAAATTKTAQQAWPATLPEQVRAVAEVLAASPVPLSLAALAAHFKGRGPWKKSLPTLLQTLEALGRVHGSGEGDARMWQSWQM